jgi:hypothetical protein
MAHTLWQSADKLGARLLQSPHEATDPRAKEKICLDQFF